MTISRVNGPGWGVGDKLTSAQANGMDLNGTYAFDIRAGQTASVASIASCTGAGRLVDSYAVGADANTTYLLSGANNIINVTSLAASRTYVLSDTGAITGDRLMILNSTGFNVTVQNAATSTLIILGPASGSGASGGLLGQDSTWADFLWNGTSWVLWRSSKPVTMTPTTFTANGTWTCPRGVTLALLIGYGGGGGGGGGTPASTTAGNSATGGGGGAGAQLVTRMVAVSAGTGYAVTIGVAGPGGGGSAAGGNGGSTTFAALATFLGGGGGTSSASSATATASATRGGLPIASVSSNWNGRIAFPTNASDLVLGAAGSGGSGVNGTAAFGAYAGNGSTEGFIGGAGGAAGANDAGYTAGGAGGGGGGGPGAVGGAGGTGGAAASAGTSGPGTVGTAGAANGGSGGGGGGAAGQGLTAGTSSAGGNGGSGQLIVIPLR